MSVAEANGLVKNFDGISALAGFSFSVGEREILGLVGPNGAGKTTLFNVLTGFLAPDSGSAVFKGKELFGLPPHLVTKLGIARTFQDLRLIRRLSVIDNVLLGFQSQPGEQLLKLFLHHKICFRQEAENLHRGEEILANVGLSEKAHDLAESLSYGQQKLLSLACCLATGADLLLLDEPVAGIAPEMVERILEIITALPGQGKSALVIEHNIDALKAIAHRMIFMDAGQKICEGAPNQVLNDPRVIEAYLD